MVHWAGEGSDVVICLARDPSPFATKKPQPSSVYISYDYGDTFEDRTSNFTLQKGTNKSGLASVDKFFNHPEFNSHVSIPKIFQLECYFRSPKNVCGKRYR